MKGINEEAHLLQLEMAALQEEAFERSKVRCERTRNRPTAAVDQVFDAACLTRCRSRSHEQSARFYTASPCAWLQAESSVSSSTQSKSSWIFKITRCSKRPRVCPQAFRRAEDHRDSAARQAVTAAARVQATAGNGKAHIWAAEVPRRSYAAHLTWLPCSVFHDLCGCGAHLWLSANVRLPA